MEIHHHTKNYQGDTCKRVFIDKNTIFHSLDMREYINDDDVNDKREYIQDVKNMREYSLDDVNDMR